MEYVYDRATRPNLPWIMAEVQGSDMQDKSIEWSRWDEVEEGEEENSKLTVCFTSELNASDKSALDSIIAACPDWSPPPLG